MAPRDYGAALQDGHGMDSAFPGMVCSCQVGLEPFAFLRIFLVGTSPQTFGSPPCNDPGNYAGTLADNQPLSNKGHQG